MHVEVETYIKNEFLTLAPEDVGLLSTRAYYLNWEKEIQRIAKGYIAEENIPKIRIVGPPLWRRILTYGSIAIIILGGIYYYRRRRMSSNKLTKG